MIEKLLQAGQWAPSASNRQPWAFIVIQDQTVLRQVAEHAAFYFIRWAHVWEVPLLIALCGDARTPIYRRFLHEDIGLAGAQIMLQAKALGLGTCWLGGLDREALAGTLRLPNNWEVVGLLTVGFPAEDPEPTERKPLEEIVHYDVYGNRRSGGKVTPGTLPGGRFKNLLRRVRFDYRSRRRSGR